jgi:hypothetical protein
LDLAAMFLGNNLVANRHANACAFTHRFCGEEWVKNPLLCRFWNARTVIGNPNGDLVWFKPLRLNLIVLGDSFMTSVERCSSLSSSASMALVKIFIITWLS